MAEKRDYYEVLGLKKGADAASIKKAFHEMAKKYHPDLHPGDKEAEEHFKEINEAYAVLSDTEKKQLYDQYGHAAFDQTQGGGPNGPGGPGGFGGFEGGFNFDDILNMFTGGFGSQGQRERNASGEDIHATMTITLEELVFGTQKEIRYQRLCVCRNCSGSGAKPGTDIRTCSKCHGTGRIKTRRQSMFGYVESVGACDACRGKGKIISTPCEKCRGAGLVKEDTTVNITLSPGTAVGVERRVNTRMGHAGKDGTYGDLYLSIQVAPHNVFKWQGLDLFCEVPITVTDAILGGEIDVPTIAGDFVKYKLPEGVQQGDQFAINGQGIPSSSNKDRRGRLLFRVNIEIPKNLSESQKKIIRQFDGECKDSNYQGKSKFLKSLRDLFKKKQDGKDKK